ncbi:hypothetical protein NV379_10815 [Paenibacillus sp. N1-5-1-14]|uniref:hypothetical protein n=1 Tax=Paenibacillus radicibacter TaxID=2972488 RepID=UPI0021592FA8|nr:hypothetical protein [Paenibacillus radicibacter]MCR8643151.1 hypothetical protein [Paenibacillus radicibacter]
MSIVVFGKKIAVTKKGFVMESMEYNEDYKNHKDLNKYGMQKHISLETEIEFNLKNLEVDRNFLYNNIK